MEVKVKICGVRTLEAAQAALSAGADYIGFNFVKSSKRYVTPEKTLEIINEIGCDMDMVGVFENAPIEEVNEIAKELSLDFVQLHGNETIAYCDNVETNVIKAFRFPADFDVKKEILLIDAYPSNYIMIDREKQGSEMLDLQKSRELAKRFHIFFAGGLTPDNVAKVVRTIYPFAVDVASSIETNGQQDLEKIKAFIKNAKGVL